MAGMEGEVDHSLFGPLKTGFVILLIKRTEAREVFVFAYVLVVFHLCIAFTPLNARHALIQLDSPDEVLEYLSRFTAKLWLGRPRAR